MAIDELLSPRSSYNESPIPQSPDANEYFGKWDSRSPSPVGHPADAQDGGERGQRDRGYKQ